MSTKPRMNLNMLGNELKDSAKQSLQGLGSLNLSQEGNRTSVPDTAPRTFKRISYQKIKSSELNDYPIDNIEEMEQLLLQYGLLNPLNVNYVEDNDIYELESGDRRLHALQNLFQRYENIDGVEDTVEYKLYRKNIHPLYVNGIDCMVEKGDTDRDSVRARIIVHNEYVRPFDALRTAEKINELAEIYTRQNKNLPKEQRFNINQRIADDLKGKYTVRQIIRYKNFDSLIDELKEVVIKHGMSISEISTYHTLTVDEQALLAHYIKQYHIPGEKLTLPSIDEIRDMVDWTTESNNSSEESSSDIQPDNDNTGSIKEEITSDFPAENEDFEELKKKAAKKLKENKDKKNDKIQSTALAIQKKTKQLERDFYDYLTDSEQIELDLSTFIKELETSIETLSNLKESVTKYERR